MSETSNVIAFDAHRPRGRRKKATMAAGAPLLPLVDSWQLALETQNKAPYTIELYTKSARRFIAYLAEHQLPADAEGVTAEHVRAFLVSEQARTSVHTSSAHHAYLGIFFNWLISEEDRTTFSPCCARTGPTCRRRHAST